MLRLRRTMLAPCSDTREYSHSAFFVFNREAIKRLSYKDLIENTLYEGETIPISKLSL